MKQNQIEIDYFTKKKDYKMVLKVFRGWQDQVDKRHRQKILKRVLLDGLMKAISKHEEFLMVKSFRTFKYVIETRKINTIKMIKVMQ